MAPTARIPAVAVMVMRFRHRHRTREKIAHCGFRIGFPCGDHTHATLCQPLLETLVRMPSSPAPICHSGRGTLLDMDVGTLNPNRERNVKNHERRKSAEKSAAATRLPRLRREIAVMLAVKAIVLYGLWFAFFSHPQLPKMTEGMEPSRVAAALIATPPTPTTERARP